MKLEMINTDNYVAFINNQIIEEVNLDHKEDVISLVKDLIIKIKEIYCLSMKGFYKVRVFPNKKVGLFLEIEKIDDIDYGKSIDLRVIVYLDERFYLKFMDYDFIPNEINTIYYNGDYYVDIHDIENDVIHFVEFGEIVYGSILEESLNKGIVIQRKKTREVF